MDVRVVCSIGLVRGNNEDYYLIDKLVGRKDQLVDQDDISMAIVFDGIAGANYGEVASMTSANYINSQNPFLKRDKEQIKNLVFETNEYLINYSKEFKQYLGMATTMAGIHFNDGSLFVFNLGDSNVLRYRSGLLNIISEDHSFNAVYNIDNPRTRNMIVYYLGKKDLKIDQIYVNEIPSGYQKDDIFIVCTDGITDYISNDKLKEILNNNNDLKTIERLIVEEVLYNGARDNYTMILIKI